MDIGVLITIGAYLAGVLTPVIVGALSPMGEGAGKDAGKLLRTTEDKVVESIKEPQLKLAVVGFMGGLNRLAIENQDKFNKAVDFTALAIESKINGKIDDIIIEGYVKPFVKSLYESYLKR